MRRARVIVVLALAGTGFSCNGSAGSQGAGVAGSGGFSGAGGTLWLRAQTGGARSRMTTANGGTTVGMGTASGGAHGGMPNSSGGAMGGSQGSGGGFGETQAQAPQSSVSSIDVNYGSSAGCRRAAPTASTSRQTLDVAGTTREYIVVYPKTYDSNHAYRVLYEFHGSGGNADENIGFHWYGVEPLSGESVIFVAPQGLGNPSGWPNTNGQDVAFIRKLVATINGSLCVDTTRVFATGFSFGGSFVNTLGCQMADVFRAIAPASSGGPRGTCGGKVAALVIHGDADATVNISRGLASRDYWLSANHCATNTTPMEPAPCVSYQGCDAGYPVAWCEHSQGHAILPAFFGPAIWNFISQF